MSTILHIYPRNKSVNKQINIMKNGLRWVGEEISAPTKPPSDTFA